jgi:low affinity Fe/Cu permease
LFDRFARHCAWLIGHPITLTVMIGAQVVWLASGLFTGFGEAWHDWNVTPLTVFTALALMPLQYSQNKDTAEIKAMLRSLVEDLSEVDEKHAVERAVEEERP